MLLSQLLTQEIKDREDASYAKGVKFGKEEGRQETQQETAYKLLALGVPLETVAAGTGLSLEEIQALLKEKK